jgi:hypothetical protein
MGDHSYIPVEPHQATKRTPKGTLDSSSIIAWKIASGMSILTERDVLTTAKANATITTF